MFSSKIKNNKLSYKSSDKSNNIDNKYYVVVLPFSGIFYVFISSSLVNNDRSSPLIAIYFMKLFWNLCSSSLLSSLLLSLLVSLLSFILLPLFLLLWLFVYHCYSHYYSLNQLDYYAMYYHYYCHYYYSFTNNFSFFT